MIVMNFGYVNGVALGSESEASHGTGAVDEEDQPILVMNDKRSKSL